MLKQLSDKIGLAVLANEPLKNHTTFKIGGPARFFVRVNNKQDLLKSLKAAHECGLPFLILGGGSNLLVSDKGFDGIVFKMEAGAIQFPSDRRTEQCSVHTFAGCNLGAFIREALKNNLSGLEFAANIPGTVGGAVWGNAGACGKGVGDFVESIEIIKLNGRAEHCSARTSQKNFSLKIMSRDECDFVYRSSIFKNNPDLIIAEIKFKLLVNEKAAELLDMIDKEWKERLEKQPLDLPSAGCAFKNVALRGSSPELGTPQRDIMENLAQLAIHGKIPVGKLIESVGLKGKKIGGAMISDKHANFIVNIGNATAADVIGLIELAKKEVKNKYNIELEQEIKII